MLEFVFFHFCAWWCSDAAAGVHFWFNQYVKIQIIKLELWCWFSQKTERKERCSDGILCWFIWGCLEEFVRRVCLIVFHLWLLCLMDGAAPVLHCHPLLGSSAHVTAHQRLLFPLADSKHPLFHGIAQITRVSSVNHVPSASCCLSLSKQASHPGKRWKTMI